MSASWGVSKNHAMNTAKVSTLLDVLLSHRGLPVVSSENQRLAGWLALAAHQVGIRPGTAVTRVRKTRNSYGYGEPQK